MARQITAALIMTVLAMAFARAFADEASCLDERRARIVASVYAGGNPDGGAGGLFPEGSSKPATLRDIVVEGMAITIVHEHSLSDQEGPRTVVTGYDALNASILKLYASDATDFSQHIEVRTLSECKDGCCDFPTHGILHNTLYLKSVCFSGEGGARYLSKVVLYDGD